MLHKQKDDQRSLGVYYEILYFYFSSFSGGLKNFLIFLTWGFPFSRDDDARLCASASHKQSANFPNKTHPDIWNISLFSRRNN